MKNKINKFYPPQFLPTFMYKPFCGEASNLISALVKFIKIHCIIVNEFALPASRMLEFLECFKQF